VHTAQKRTGKPADSQFADSVRALKKFKSKSQLINTTSVVDRHRFDADPDPDPTFHFDADPDPDTTSFIHKFEYCSSSLS
jgi:hypothetical protein